MRRAVSIVMGLAASLAAASPAAAECADPKSALGVSRIVEIDTTSGPLYGDMTKYTREESFLGPKEVVLTFDDGPMPWITKSILDTLDRFCTKATFFSVGRMALAYPSSVKDVMARGHTLGTHTWTHPLNIARLSPEKAKDQIERGFAAVALAAGQPIAPFFRFPGLSDSNVLLAHLQERGIAAFTVDVVSNDSFIGDPRRLYERTIRQTEGRNGGIILFHDIKASAAKALPDILTWLKANGYSVVHMRPKASVTVDAGIEAELKPLLAKLEERTKGNALMPFYGSAAALRTPQGGEPQVTELAPEARSRPSGGQKSRTLGADDEAAGVVRPHGSSKKRRHGQAADASDMGPPKPAAKPANRSNETPGPFNPFGSLN